MERTILKVMEAEFLELKPYFSYCFSKDKRKNNKEAEYITYTFNSIKGNLKNSIELSKKLREFDYKHHNLMIQKIENMRKEV